MINHRRRVSTSLLRAHGLRKASQNSNRVIYGRHEQCRWPRSCANLLHLTPNLKMHRKSSKMCPRISSTSPPSAFLLAAIYDQISVLRGFGKSAGTLWTCFDLPPTFADNFNFSVFGHNFEKIQHVFYIITTKSCSKCNRSASKMHKNHVFGKNFVFSKKFK